MKRCIKASLRNAFIGIWYLNLGGQLMEYRMRVVIEDPNVEPGMVAELLFDLDRNFNHHPTQYGNGYYLSISGKGFGKQIVDLRYDTSFDRNNHDNWLYTWDNNYW